MKIAELAAQIAACERDLGRSLTDTEKIDFVLDHYPDIQDAVDASVLLGQQMVQSLLRVAAELFADPSLEARTLLNLLADCTVLGEALDLALSLAAEYLAKRS